MDSNLLTIIITIIIYPVSQTVGDRIQGLKEELKGSIKHDPQLKQTGKDRISGELKRREREQVGLVTYRICEVWRGYSP